ncbi:TPA: hypothetical protein ACHSMM_004508 [Yersinia enterocolitica]
MPPLSFPRISALRTELLQAAQSMVTAKQRCRSGDAAALSAVDAEQESYENLLLSISAEDLLLLIKI